MWHMRLDVTGPKPKGQCVISSHELCKEVVKRGLDRRLGQGPCRVVEGSFHVAPKTIGSWARHWFVMFGNGSIADITADQFDTVPKLWWPAEASRYALWVGDHHVPLSSLSMGKAGHSLGWAIEHFGWSPDTAR
mmetsp:Transcript_17651/g.51530  ORF Transcript_17651/g.51530 Transcript_17651/m.51530 type:complete len:134 (+) Transcript_17651:2-403(+)